MTDEGRAENEKSVDGGCKSCDARVITRRTVVRIAVRHSGAAVQSQTCIREAGSSSSCQVPHEAGLAGLRGREG